MEFCGVINPGPAPPPTKDAVSALTNCVRLFVATIAHHGAAEDFGQKLEVQSLVSPDAIGAWVLAWLTEVLHAALKLPPAR